MSVELPPYTTHAIQRLRCLIQNKVLTAAHLPELFRLTGSGPNRMITLIRPAEHLALCPVASGKRRSGRHVDCHCVLHACEAIIAERAHADTEKNVAAANHDEEPELLTARSGREAAERLAVQAERPLELKQPFWLALACAGAGCDAEAAVEAASYAGGPITENEAEDEEAFWSGEGTDDGFDA